MNSQSNHRVDAFLGAWTSSLTLLLSRLGSEGWEVRATAAPEVLPAAIALRASAPGLPGLTWLVFSLAEAGKLLELFLGEAVSLTGELDGTLSEALEELVRQWCGLAASALKPDFGELSFTVAREAAPPGKPPSPVRLLQATGGAQSIAVGISLEPELEAFLQKNDRPPDAAMPAAVPSSRVPVGELLRQGNLDLLMDVELPVMLRFGTRQVTLREVLDLATGAVLELDREVQEPVELVLNDRWIARGEVVVVDGNYGLRVTEVASPRERVNSL